MRKQDSYVRQYGLDLGTRLYKWLQHKSARARWGRPPAYPRPTA